MPEYATYERDTVEILGIAVDRVTMAAAADRLAGFIGRCRAAAEKHEALPPVAHVVTANSEIAMMAVEDKAVFDILAQAALIVPDGIGLVWAARLLGRPVPERVAGIDLMTTMLARCAEEQWRPYLLGAAPGVAEEAAERLRRRWPRLDFAGMHHGYFRPEEAAGIVADINAAQPDLLLVAMGAPRQEKWIAAHRGELRVPVAVGVGGSLDIWAGRTVRAPQWMCNAGLEWAYRLMRQPSRAMRMTALPRFAAAVLWHKWRRSGRMQE